MVVQEALVGKDFPVFVGNNNLSPELISWRNIRDSFLQYPTDHSIERIIGLQLAADALEKDGLKAGLMIGGSLAVGQSDSYSDIDVFGVVVRNEKADCRKIIEAYQKKLRSEIGKYVEFPVTADTSEFILTEIASYLASKDFELSMIPDPTARFCLGDFTLRHFHVGYQTSIMIGESGQDLIGKIEDLKSNPQLVRELNPALTLKGYTSRFTYSFNKYLYRLVQHPAFSRLEEPEKELFIDMLREHENQFLFYTGNPQFCTYP